MKEVKIILIELVKFVGAILLLIVLIYGIADVLLYVATKKDWTYKNQEGEKVDYRYSISFLIGIPVWIWIISRIHLAGMSDDEKEDSERYARLHPPDDSEL